MKEKEEKLQKIMAKNEELKVIGRRRKRRKKNERKIATRMKNHRNAQFSFISSPKYPRNFVKQQQVRQTHGIFHIAACYAPCRLG